MGCAHIFLVGTANESRCNVQILDYKILLDLVAVAIPLAFARILVGDALGRSGPSCQYMAAQEVTKVLTV